MKSLAKTGLGIIVIVMLITSCATVSNINVSNLSDANASPAGSFVYSLPITVLDVFVEAEEIDIIPGPYARYAQKYLGIKDVPIKPEKVFSIKNVNLTRHLEADPDFIFSVNGVNDLSAFPQVLNLIKDSLILSPADFSGELIHSYTYPGVTSDLYFKDLSIKRNFEAEKDVDISMVLPDSGYQKPSARTINKEKTPEQKAEEAANFLIKLKKRRFKLVAGQYAYMPNGEAMGAALDEMARLEQEYLSLFIGKRVSSRLARTYHYSPEAGKGSDRAVLFRFSSAEGFIDFRETAGIPVLLEIEAAHKERVLENYTLPAKLQSNTLPYRIADQARLRLLTGEQIRAEAILPVFQFGVPVSLTVNH
jgi:hypothetical protein